MESSLIFRSKIIINAYQDWILNSDRILDVGCGNGIVTDELRKFFKCEITGTDILDYRRRKINFKIMQNKEKFDFQDNEFSICMFNDVLHHSKCYESLLNEAARVAEKIIIFEMEPSFMASTLDILINKIHNPAMEAVVNLKSPQEWKMDFLKSGYTFEFRKINKPVFFYPFANFSFKLARTINSEKKN